MDKVNNKNKNISQKVRAPSGGKGGRIPSAPSSGSKGKTALPAPSGGAHAGAVLDTGTGAFTMPDTVYSLAVIGGGASGFACAITAAETGLKNIIILEAAARTGKKIAASGNGQGNIGNANFDLKHYHGGAPGLARRVFEAVPPQRIMQFYKSCGIEVVQDKRGRLYPQSYQASSVLDCLRLKCAELSVQETCGFKAISLSRQGGAYRIDSAGGGAVFAASVAVCCGGAASPHLSGGTGYALLEQLGHSKSRLTGSLVQLKTAQSFKALKGIKTEAEVSIAAAGKTYSSRGDLLFTDFGVSGSAVFDVSGYAVRAAENGEAVLSIDFLPEVSAEDLKQKLYQRIKDFPRREIYDFMAGFLNKQIARELIKQAGLANLSSAKDIAPHSADMLVKLIKGYNVTVTGGMGLKNAQVTIGGIEPEEFNADNLMSTKSPGIYACGEILDIDGDCGGYNLMWAVASGIYAALGIVSTSRVP